MLLTTRWYYWKLVDDAIPSTSSTQDVRISCLYSSFRILLTFWCQNLLIRCFTLRHRLQEIQWISFTSRIIRPHSQTANQCLFEDLGRTFCGEGFDSCLKDVPLEQIGTLWGQWCSLGGTEATAYFRHAMFLRAKPGEPPSLLSGDRVTSCNTGS